MTGTSTAPFPPVWPREGWPPPIRNADRYISRPPYCCESSHPERVTLNTVHKKLLILVLIFACGAVLGALYMHFLSQGTAYPAKHPVYTRQAPEPIGPYSQGVQSGGFVWLSGQVGIDPSTGNLTGGIEEQTTRAMENQKAVLAVSGLTFADVVQTRIYLTSMSDFATVNRIYGTYFTDTFPARSTVQVAGLPKGALVEIEMVAEKR